MPAKYICNESVNLTITKFSGLFNVEEMKDELLASSSCSLLIFLLVEIFIKGNLIIFETNLIIAKKVQYEISIPKYINP